ncbi:HEAT repeat domain-containing protein [Candidatus Uabimicrobium amorphum]|uniref:HEAT repeat domain-containing protein n=1 Tax=Uabimicrobium amorphum TaxID=2596890 RepID=UPI0034A4C300
MKKFVLLTVFLFVYLIAENNHSQQVVQKWIDQLQNGTKKQKLSAIKMLKEISYKEKLDTDIVKKIWDQTLKEDDNELVILIQKMVRSIEKKQLHYKHTSIKPKKKSYRADPSNLTKNLGGITVLGSSNDFPSKQKYENCYAIVIGINEYDNFTDLQGPNFDASEIAKVLNDRYQFKNILLLTDKAPIVSRENIEVKLGKVTKELIENSIKKLKTNKIKSKDALFFYYAGHGVPGYIVAGDSQKVLSSGQPAKETMISLTKIAKNLEVLNARHTLMVLDSCFSGSLLEKEHRPDFSHLTSKEFVDPGGNNLTRVFNRRAFQVITAGAGDEVVADKLDEISTVYAQQFKNSRGHSPFTAVFLQAIQGLTGRDDGIILASQLGFYMMDTLVNDDRIKASQAPRYENVGGNGDFMFFPSEKVLNPKMVAPLYLNGIEFAVFRRSGCEALKNFIHDQKNQKEKASLIKSALPHIAKLLEDKQSIPCVAALKFIKHMTQDYAEVKEFSIIVPTLVKILTQKKNPTFFSMESNTHLAIECLGSLSPHIKSVETVDILKKYHQQQKAKWEKQRNRLRPEIVEMEEEKLKKQINRKLLSQQANDYYENIKIYYWLNSKGVAELDKYEGQKNLFLSVAEKDTQKRLDAFEELKEKLEDQDFIDYFVTRDKNIRKQVLKFLEKDSRDLAILLELLAKKYNAVRFDVAKDLEMIGERAFLSIINRLAIAKDKNNLSSKTHLLLPFENWKKKSLFSFISKLDKEEKKFFLPYLVEVNFENLYSEAINPEIDEETRLAISYLLGEKDVLEPFIAKFFLSINAIDALGKKAAILTISQKKKYKYSIVMIFKELLKSPNNDVRSSAAEILGQIERKAEEVVPALIPLLQDQNSGVRSSAVSALGLFGKKAEKAVPSIVSLLKDPDEDVRRKTEKSLKNIGTAETITVFIQLLQNQDSVIRSFAVEILGRIGEKAHSAVPALILALKDQDSWVRSSVAEALGKIGEKAHSAVPDLIPLLQDKNSSVRRYVVEALGKIGQKAHSAIPALILALKDNDVRSSAVEALGKIGEKAHSAVPDLIPLLQDKNSSVRQHVVDTLGKIGEKAHAAVPALILALKDQDIWVTEALGKIGEKAVPALILALEDENKYVRAYAAQALGAIREKAQKAVPNLIFLIKNGDENTKEFAAQALGKIGKKAVPALILALEDENKYVRAYAAQALGAIGEKAEKAVPTLISLLQNQDENVRRNVVDALGQIGEKAEQAVPALIALLENENDFIESVVRALGRIGEKAFSSLILLSQKPILQAQDFYITVNAQQELKIIGEKAVPVFILLLQDPDSYVRSSAAKALRIIGEKAEQAVPALISLLQDQDSQVRNSAVQALGAIGKKAEKAVPALIPLLQDENVRMNVVEALGAIGEKAEQAVPALIPLLQDENVKISVLETLGLVGEKAVPVLIPLLQDENVHMRILAARALGAIGEKAEQAVPALIPLLQDKNRSARATAIRTLGNIGEKAYVVSSFLIPLLKKDKHEKIETIRALGKIGEKSHTVVPSLVNLLQDKNSDVRREASVALNEIGEKALLSLIPLLRENILVRSQAVQILGKIGEKSSTVTPFLIPLLQEKDVGVRGFAAAVLGEIGRDAVFSLILLLQDNNQYVKREAAKALEKMGEKAEKAVPTLISLLQDQDSEVRSSVIKALGSIGEKAEKAIPTLISLLQDQHAEVRSSAARALGNIGEKSIPILTPLLKDSDKYVRKNAIRVLGNIGEKAVPTLIPLLKSLDKYDRRNAAEALGQIGEKAEEVVPILTPLLKDPDKYVRMYTAEALGKIGEKAHTAVPDLILLLQDKNSYVGVREVEALGLIGEKAEQAAPVLISFLQEPNLDLKFSAAEALIQLGKVEEAIPALVSLIKEEDFFGRTYAIKTLGKIGEKAEKAVPTLILLLKNEDWLVKSSAAETLGMIGKKAEKAVPTLILLLQDDNRHVEKSVVEALIRIEKISPLIPLLRNKNYHVRYSAKKILINIGEKVLPFIREFVQTERNKATIESGLAILNRCLWNAYLEEKKIFHQMDIELLSLSKNKNYFDTVATIYAWQGNAKKAYEYAAKAIAETPKRVKLLLEGKAPKQVEENMKKK